MPQINLIPEVLYEPNQPYHYIYDNIPLKNILARISLVNIQTDVHTEVLMGTAGSTGSLADRLNVSLEENGSLKESSVDSTMHNIAYHSDGEKDGVEYVRMLAEERSKLSLVESEANLLTVQVEDNYPLTNGNVEFRNSSTIAFELQAPNVIKAHSNFPPDIAHRHEYGKVPVRTTSDWRHFKTTTLATPYMEGSLRVYINGVRVSSGTYVPIFTTSSSPSSWMLFSLSSEDAANGTFELNSEIPSPSSNSIIIDFDVLLPLYSTSSSSSSS